MTTAAGPPPAAATPMAANWAVPAYTSIDIAMVIHHGRPCAVASAAKEAPATPIPTLYATVSRSRSRPTSSVRRANIAPGYPFRAGSNGSALGPVL